MAADTWLPHRSSAVAVWRSQPGGDVATDHLAESRNCERLRSTCSRQSDLEICELFKDRLERVRVSFLG
jgi:hypothetical protein